MIYFIEITSKNKTKGTTVKDYFLYDCDENEAIQFCHDFKSVAERMNKFTPHGPVTLWANTNICATEQLGQVLISLDIIH